MHHASRTPAAPPQRLTRSPSPSTSPSRSTSVAPSARLMPKSRMRSKTAAVTVFASDNPPMSSARAPMPKSSAVKKAVDWRRRRLSSPGMVTLRPATAAWMRFATASGSSPSFQPTAAPVLRSPRRRLPAPKTCTRSGSRLSHSSRASSMATSAKRSGAVKVFSRMPTTAKSCPPSDTVEPARRRRAAANSEPSTVARRSPGRSGRPEATGSSR